MAYVTHSCKKWMVYKGLVWTNTRKLRMNVITTPTVWLRHFRFISLA